MGQSDYERYLEGLRQRRAPAMERAARLIDEGRFDEADQAVKAADDSIYGAVALAGLYKATLAGSHASRRREWRQRVYEKAVWWAESAFPEPHTAIETENYDRGREEARAELTDMLGDSRNQSLFF